jgi:hypothetical protein
MNRVWSATFSMPGFVAASALGCVAGAVCNALRPVPMRNCSHPMDSDDDHYCRVSNGQWILEGMWYGSIMGFAINLTWPVLLCGGIPLGAIYAGAIFLKKQQSFVKEKN